MYLTCIYRYTQIYEVKHLDGISFYAIRLEMAKHLPLRVQKIYHPNEKELLFKLWSNTFRGYLLLSLSKEHPFIGIISEKPQTPQIPSGLCLGLRKRLESGTLQSIRQESLDRVLYFDFSGRDNLGNLKDYTLVFDAAGSNGGIGLIVDKMTELCLPKSGRRIHPGNTYMPPKSLKHNLISHQNLALLAKKICTSDRIALKSIISHVEGFGKDLALSILAKANLPAHQPLIPENTKKIAFVLNEVKFSLEQNEFSPALYLRRSGEPLLGTLPFYHLEPVKRFQSVLESVATYWSYMCHYERYTALLSQVKSVHKMIVDKITRRFEAQKQDLDDAKQFEQYRVWGELIHSSGQTLPRGHTQIEVLDYYQNPPTHIIVPLDPKLSSTENARRYYARYTKLQRANKILKNSINEAKTFIGKLDNIHEQLNQDNDIDTLISIRNELIKISKQSNVRIPKRRLKPPRRRMQAQKNIRKDLTEAIQTIDGPDSSLVFIGKTAAANDHLIRHLRKAGDIWLHAKGVKGSHVLLRTHSGLALSHKALEFAAVLAAQYSEAATSGKVEVDWADAAAVTKPKGSPPGFVTYKGEKTVLVNTY